jgi:Holliday junction resolvasome RuvABC endonuclease subunit
LGYFEFWRPQYSQGKTGFMPKIYDHSRVLGVRAEPGAINWAIVEGSQEEPILHASGTEKAPTAYSEAEGLAWVRKKSIHIIEQYRPTGVAVRYPEPKALGANKDSAKARCRVEGVVLEVAAHNSLEVVTETLNTISKNLDSKSAKAYLSSDEFRGLDWSKCKEKVQEAILVAVSILRGK